MCNIVYYVQRNMHQNLQDNLMHKALSIVDVKYNVHCATYYVQYKVLCTIYHVEYTVRNIMYYVQYICFVPYIISRTTCCNIYNVGCPRNLKTL